MHNAPPEIKPVWHHLHRDELLALLNTDGLGLTEDEALIRLHKYGANKLAPPSRQSPVVRFLRQFHNILIYVLIGAAVITALLDHMIDTAVILAVVLINAIIGFVQEGKAEQAMDAIRQMLTPRASIIRNGERLQLNAEQLVPGDLVLLAAGDKVPADLRLISAHGLTIQEAILTGESVPVEKNCLEAPIKAVLGDRRCMAFCGTLVSSGQAKGLVVATGTQTEIGHISGLLHQVQQLTTPLIRQMAVFSKWLTIFILAIAALLLLYGYLVGHHQFSDLFMAVVGLSVAAIPEGLPAVLTITLAIGVQAMARRNAIVRRLPAIETLGAVSVICTDKTGTLTRNEMMVASVLTSRHYFSLDGDGYAPVGVLRLHDVAVVPTEYKVLSKLAHAAILCNDATLTHSEKGWQVGGDPMEGALLAFAQKMELSVCEQQSRWQRTDAIPFDAKHRFMATLHHDHLHHAVILVKGAPEQLLGMCIDQLDENGLRTTLDRLYWTQLAETTAEQGQRLLAFAVRDVRFEHTVLSHHDVATSLTLLGMVGMIDPPRPEAISAVAECYAAGIRVKMITGDHAKTAAAIAKQVGLRNFSTVLSGMQLEQMDDTTLQQAVLNCDIFARTSPEHKLRLVMALQAHGLTVAMTGDGVNDGPALKRADAGIAMGSKGSEVAKEAAELVLADDNFASIVAAIREGRTVYDNIRKVISWTLPTSAGEALTIVAALLFGFTLPITPIQILWVNLITATTLGIALAFEPSEANTMRRPPRARHEALLNRTLLWHIVLVALLFLCGVYGIYTYAIERGDSIELARTLAVNTLVVMEIFHLFFIRNFYTTSLSWQAVRGTRVVWVVVAAVSSAQFAITYLPPLQSIFATEAVSLPDGILIVAIGLAMFAVIEIEKQIRLAVNRLQNSNV